jgi:hypothetical protein
MDKETNIFNKMHQQICNDLGLPESDSSETAARNCEIIAKQQAIGFAEWITQENYQMLYGCTAWEKFPQTSTGRQYTTEELYSLYLTQQK